MSALLPLRSTLMPPPLTPPRLDSPVKTWKLSRSERPFELDEKADTMYPVDGERPVDKVEIKIGNMLCYVIYHFNYFNIILFSLTLT